MKHLYNKFSVILAAALYLTLAACTEEVLRDASPAQDGGVQAYIPETNRASRSFLPDAPTTFTVTIGRQNTTGRVSVPLSLTEEKGRLKFENGVAIKDTAITFEDGKALVELVVDFSKMALGESTSLKLAIKNDADRYLYGLPEYNITVERDYKWVDVGKVTFYDGFWTGETAKIPVQQAAGTQLFRFPNIYSEIFLALDPTDPDIEACRGYHLQFYLDTTYTDASKKYRSCKADSLPSGDQDLGIGMYGYIFLWGGSYASSCAFTNDGNVYTINGLMKEDGVVSYRCNYQFTWTDGFPGEIPEPKDPYEGETITLADTLKLTASSAAGSYSGYNYTYNKKDEYGGTEQVFVINYIVQLATDNGDAISLDVLAPYESADYATKIPAGTYTINSSDKENSVRTGNFAEYDTYGTGSYAQISATAISSDFLLYFTSGTVKFEYGASDNLTITIDAGSAKGSAIQATYSGVSPTLTDLTQ
jgi:hypothetical protein